MPSLLQALQQANPATTDDDASLFRSALVAILSQLQGEDGVSIQRSLKDWKQWLDDGAYESAYLMTILGNVAEASMGVLPSQELIDYIQEISANPGGLPLLIEHVQSSCPLLSQKIEELETLAIEEEQQLHTLAGGMSKAGKDTAIAAGIFGGTVVTALTIKAGVGYARRFTNWVMGETGEIADRGIQLARREARSDSLQDFVLRAGARHEDQLRDNVRSNISSLYSDAKVDLADITRQQRAAGMKEVIEKMQDPDHIPFFKNLKDYTEQDIKVHAELLVMKHAKVFESEVNEEILNKYRGLCDEERNNIIDDVFRDHGRDVFERLDGNEAADEIGQDFKDALGGLPSTVKLELIRNLEANNPLFKNLGNRSLLIDLNTIETQVKDGLADSYSKLLSAEVLKVQNLVDEVKVELVDDVESDFNRDLQNLLVNESDNGIIHRSEVKVQLDIEEKAREAEVVARATAKEDISVAEGSDRLI